MTIFRPASRIGAVYFTGLILQVSEAAEVVVVAGFDAESGRCYSAPWHDCVDMLPDCMELALCQGLVLQAHSNFPHKFSRTVEEASSAC